MKNTVISIIIAMIIGLIINATWIAPVATEARVSAVEAAQPIKINAKRAIALRAEIEKIEADQKAIDRSFGEAFCKKDFEFKINNKLVSYKHEIKTDLNQIRSLIRLAEYDKAATEINNYKMLLKEQVRDCYGWMGMNRMLVCLMAADRNGVRDYFTE